MNKILLFLISFVIGALTAYFSFLALKKAVNSAFENESPNKSHLAMLLNLRFIIEVLVLIFFIFYVKLNFWFLFAGWFLSQMYIKYKKGIKLSK